MTAMDAKEYLRGIGALQHYLMRLKNRRKNLHLDVSFGAIDYAADRIQSTPKNKLEEAAVRLSDRIERIDREIAKTSVEIDDRIATIEKVSSDTHRDILYKRYVDGKSFEEISVEMGYVYNYTCNLHGDALRELSKVLNFS